jgi:type IV pilus assembly protein PilO
MELSLSKLPWWGQLGAFVLVSIGAVFGFWYLYVADVRTDIEGRETRLRTMRADVARGQATARQLPEFEAQVVELEQRLDSLRAVLPEEKDVADILRRVQGLATQSNLTIQRFTPQPARQQNMYAELPFRLTAEGTYHNLGMFFDRVSKFPRIINIGEISVKARQNQEPNATIVAELVATTFILQEGQAAVATGRNVVPRQPSIRK